MPDPSESLIALERWLNASPVFREVLADSRYVTVRGWYMANQLKIIELKKTNAELLREHAEMLARIDALLAK